MHKGAISQTEPVAHRFYLGDSTFVHSNLRGNF